MLWCSCISLLKIPFSCSATKTGKFPLIYALISDSAIGILGAEPRIDAERRTLGEGYLEILIFEQSATGFGLKL